MLQFDHQKYFLGVYIMFFAPIPLIRQNLIIRKLSAAGAFSQRTAVTLREAGIINPNGFSMITRRMEKRGIIAACGDGKYYLKR